MVLYAKATESTVILVEQRGLYYDYNGLVTSMRGDLKLSWYQKRLVHDKDGCVCIVPCLQRVWPASLAPFVVNFSFTAKHGLEGRLHENLTLTQPGVDLRLMQIPRERTEDSCEGYLSTKDGVQVDCKVSVEAQINSSSDDKIFNALHPNYNPMWSGSWAGQAIPDGVIIACANRPIREMHAVAERGLVYYLQEAVRQYLVRELMQLTHADLVAGLGKKDKRFPLSDSALRAHLRQWKCSRIQRPFDDSHAILRAHIDVQPAPEGPGGGGEVDGGAYPTGGAYPAGGVAPAGIVLVDPGLAATSATKEAPHNLAIPRDTIEAWEREADELKPNCSKCDCRLASWRTYALGSNQRIYLCDSTCTCIPLLLGCAFACCVQPPCPCFWVCCAYNGCKDGSYCRYLRSEEKGVIWPAQETAQEAARRRHREQFLAKKHYSVCFGMDAAVDAPDMGW